MQLKPPANPSLPFAPLQYAPSYHERQNSALRQYFNTIDAALRQLLFGFNNYGAFYNTASQTAAVINTAYPLTFSNTGSAFGISLAAGSQVYVTQTGMYNIALSTQLDKTTGGSSHAHFWLRVNGTDYPNSGRKVVVNGNNDESAVSWSANIPLSGGDYIELVWAVADTTVYLLAEVAAAPVPAIPSATLFVTYLFPGDV